MAGIPKIVVNRVNQILNNLLLKNNNETNDIDYEIYKQTYLKLKIKN